MNLFADAFAWIVAAEQWSGTGSIPVRLGEHLLYSLLAFAVAAAIAIPIGYLIGHTGRGRAFAIGLSGAARALPSFGLILLLVIVIGVLQVRLAVIIALVLLAIPSILAGAYAGLEAVDRRTIDAARAIGMTEWQILTKVEVPLGLPLLISGLRAGLLQIVATATLASYVGLGGLGYDILQGIQLQRFDQTLGGALIVVVLAFALDALFGLLEQFGVPRGVRLNRGGRSRGQSRAIRAEQRTDTASRFAQAGAAGGGGDPA
ncbi:MAG TPA: ABC transporter permease [Naasia sp.]